MSKTSESIPQIFSKEIIVDSENSILTIRGDGISGSGANLYNLTSSNISNFTNDVRNQFTAGSNITIIDGNISSTGGSSGSVTLPGGINKSIQFNSGSTFSGSSNLVYDYINDRFGIGTSSPSYTLDISSPAGPNAIYSKFYSSNGGVRFLSNNGVGQIDLIDISNTNIITLYNAGDNRLVGVNNTDFSFYTNSTEKMRITAGGNVGIGTTTPEQKLHVSGGNILVDGGGDLRIRPTSPGGDGVIRFMDTTGVNRSNLYFAGTDLLRISDLTADRFVLNSAGNVGIGTISPQTKLHISGNGGILNLEATDHSYIQFYPGSYSSGRKSYFGFPSSGSTVLTIANENSTNGHIALLPGASGGVGIGTNSPIYTLSVIGTLGVSGNTTISTISGTTAQFSQITGNLFGTASFSTSASNSTTVTNGIYTNANNTFIGINTFNTNYITGSISGSDAKFISITGSVITGSVVTGSTAKFTYITGSVITGSIVTGSTALFSQITGNLFGTASFATSASNSTTVTNGIYTNANNTFTGINTFNTNYITGSISGSDAKFTKISGTQAYFSEKVGIGSFAYDSVNPEKLLISGSNINLIVAKSNIDSYSQVNINNLASTANASCDVVATNNIGNETDYYIDMGINSSGFAGSLGLANEAYIYNTGSNLWIGNATPGANGNIKFFAGNLGTSVAMFVSSSGRIGIGTILPNYTLAVTGTLGVSGSSTFSIVSGTTAQFTTISGTNVTGTTALFNTITASTGMYINNGNLVFGSSGKGIDFSITTNATTGSSGSLANELFSDYEEGTWTPIFGGSTGTDNATYLATEGQVGYYTKIGNTVYLQGRVALASTGSTTGGNVRIKGFPFTSKSTGTTVYSSLTVGFHQNINLTISSISILANSLGTSGSVYYISGTGVAALGAPVVLPVLSCSNSAIINFAGFYFT